MRSSRPKLAARAPHRTAAESFCALLAARYELAGRRGRTADARRRPDEPLDGGFVWLRWPKRQRLGEALRVGVPSIVPATPSAAPVPPSAGLPRTLIERHVHEVQRRFERIRERVLVGVALQPLPREQSAVARGFVRSTEPASSLVRSAPTRARDLGFVRGAAELRARPERERRFLSRGAAPARGEPRDRLLPAIVRAREAERRVTPARSPSSGAPEDLEVRPSRALPAAPATRRANAGRGAPPDGSPRDVEVRGHERLSALRRRGVPGPRMAPRLATRIGDGSAETLRAAISRRLAAPAAGAVPSSRRDVARAAAGVASMRALAVRLARTEVPGNRGSLRARLPVPPLTNAVAVATSGARPSPPLRRVWAAAAGESTFPVAPLFPFPRVEPEVQPRSGPLPLVPRSLRPNPPLPALSLVSRREKTVNVRELQETVTRRVEETLERRVVQNVETAVARELAPDSALARRLGERLYGGLYESLVLEKERMGWG